MQQKTLIKKRKTRQNHSNFEDLLVILFCWLVPLIWVISIPRNTTPWKEKQHTEKLLKKGKILVEKFQKEFGYAPKNLSSIRAFSGALGIKFTPWDAYGQRLDYMTFDANQWFLRSFGIDGKQNTLMSPQDPLISNINAKTIKGVKHSYQNTAVPYNPVILSGSTSPQEQWHAQLLQDNISGSSKLLVRHRKRTSYFLIAPHDTVEEFYWLPDGYRIVYSATGSGRYKDGIYIWNLLDDTSSIIFPSKKSFKAVTFANDSKYWNIALAGITQHSPPKLLTFIEGRDSYLLDINTFYSKKNLFAISIPIKAKPEIFNGNKINPYFSKKNFFQNWQPNVGVSNCNSSVSAQNTWCQLSIDTDLQLTIENWQSYAEKNSQTPLFPYTLLHLSRFYQNTIEEIIKKPVSEINKEATINDTEILKSYGLELASALSNLPTSPGWIRGAALHLFQNIQNTDLARIETLKMEQRERSLDLEEFTPPNVQEKK